MKTTFRNKKAFTLIELLIVIAIIGILFIVLISKVDFATDKAKATGVQTDFRSFQLAFETVARENQGFDELVDDNYDKLEAAINKNLDNKLHIDIDADGNITMANNAKDPWGIEYHGQYVTGDDGKDRGAIVMYSNGADMQFGSEVSLTGGVTSIKVVADDGNDDYVLVTSYTLKNGYEKVKTMTSGFSQNYTDKTNSTPGLEDNKTNSDSNMPLVSAPEFAGATFRGYLICEHTTNGLLGHNDSCFVYEEVTLTWEELKDPANGEKYSYNASAIGDTVLGESAFEDCHTIASINIPEGITIIEDIALGWTYIHDVKLPSTLKEIGEDVFSCMYGEAALYIPDGVEILGDSVAYQTGIRSLRIPGTVKVVPEYAFECSPFLKTVILEEGIERIEGSAFDYSGMLSEITIPSTVTYIGEYAFAGCPSLTTIDFAPNSQLQEIGERAFYDNAGLITITIPETVTSIASDVFTECPKLVEIINLSNAAITSDMVDDLNTIDIHNGSTKVINQNGYLFYNIDGVDYLMGTDGITGTAQPPAYYNGKTYQLHSYVFCGEHGIDNYIIPNTITEIPDYAFATNYKTNSVIVPSSVTTLGEGLFENITWADTQTGGGHENYYFYKGDYGVATIIFEDNSTLQNINEDVWYADSDDIINIHITDISSWSQFSLNYNYYNLYVNGQTPTKIVINDGITKIGSHVFNTLESVEEIVIPASVEVIENGGLPKHISKMVLLGTPNQICFRSPQIDNLYYYDTLSRFNEIEYYIPDGWGGNITRILNDTNLYINDELVTHVDVSATDDITNLEGCASIVSVTFLEGVTNIPDEAFKDCKNLLHVTFPSTLVSIGYNALSGCNLSYTQYDNAEYYGTTDNPYMVLIKATSKTITSVDIHPDTKIIAGGAFANCNSLTNVIIPEGIISISSKAFAWCNNLTSIVIPKSVNYIGELIFSSNRKTIYYSGTSAEFSAMTKDANWNKYYSGGRYYTISYSMSYNYQ